VQSAAEGVATSVTDTVGATFGGTTDAVQPTADAATSAAGTTLGGSQSAPGVTQDLLSETTNAATGAVASVQADASSVTAPVVQVAAAASHGVASVTSHVAAVPGAGALVDAAHATAATGAAAASAAADVSAAASAAFAEAFSAATPGLRALGSAVPIGEVAGAAHGVGAAASAVAGAFEPPPFDPTTLPHLLGTLEGRVVLITLLSLFAAGRASGLGGVGFAQPLLVNCRSTLQLAFGPVRLIPCAAGAAVQSVAGNTGDVFEGAGRVVDRIRGSGGSAQRSVPRQTGSVAARSLAARTRNRSAATAGLVARPAAVGGQMLLRLVVSILAVLSGLLAAAAALEREKRERVRQQYRRRLHS
jgi:hypothetical protein